MAETQDGQLSMTKPTSLIFTHQNRELEVKAYPTNNGWSVRVFEGDTAVTSAIYSVSYEVETDLRTMRVPERLDGKPIRPTPNPVEELMKLAQSDVERGNVKLSERI